jgi:S1-C subfamily serine protease
VEGNVGVGFAIPINRAVSLLPSLEKGIAIQHPALGITAQTLTASTASQLGITGQTSGVLVIDAAAGGPAAAAGLHGTGQADAGDDLITAIDGHALASVDQLTQYLDSKKVGDRVTLSVIRNGQRISVGVTLGAFQPRASATP